MRRFGFCGTFLPALLASAVLFCASLAGANPVKTERVTATLESEVAAVAPGEKFWVALRQQIIPKWHTYWLNPGDSGLPTEITWILPAGAAAEPIVWPVPKRIPVGPLVNYGYENDVRLLVQVTAPKDARPGDTLRLEAQARWLVCEEICIPEEGTLVLEVPVAAASAIDAARREGFAAARAALPIAAPFTAAVAAPKTPQATTTLHIDMPADMAATVKDAYFFSERIDAVVHAERQMATAGKGGLSIGLPTGPLPLKPDEPLSGILRIVEKPEAGGQTHAFAITANPDPNMRTALVAMPSGGAAGEGISILEAMGLALLGGLLLNLMPCVFPILSMKALSLVQAASGERRAARVHGLFYVAGVLLSFLIVAGVLLALRAGGESIGWGFQLQSSWFVLVLAYLIFVVGLNLAGLFDFAGSRFAGIGDSLTQKKGGSGAFFTGVLAVVVATPCTAPFMGAALGFALSQPAPAALAIFLALGLGMALPFLLLSIFPQALRLLPRPGPWMERFRQFLAFPMFATAAWLVWVLAQQSGPNGLALALAGMVLIGFAIWLLRQLGGVRKAASRIAYASFAAIALLAALGTIAVIDSPVVAATAPTNAKQASDGEWQAWSAAAVEQARAQGKPVFVNFTAAWCITCLVNERTSLATETVRNKFTAAGVVRLKGDWTRRDKAISDALAEFGRSGVPLYVLYPADRAQIPRVLPQILTETGILAELDRL
jgi:thiol:disulfide interchange protein/DsbC/DsbD-like thiol-disulfide interchange protein